MARTTAFAVVLAAVLAIQARAQDLIINTPGNFYQCANAQFTYICPNSPCTIVARPSADASQQIKDFGSNPGPAGAVSWLPVNQAQGSSFTMWITDSQGNTISSAPVVVGSGSDGCLNGSASSGSSGSSGSSASPAATSAGGRASSAASSAASGASSAASHASGAATSAKDTAEAAASPSASAGTDNGNGAASLAIKGSLVGAALLAASAALI